jgi:hypothetical protein
MKLPTGLQVLEGPHVSPLLARVAQAVCETDISSCGSLVDQVSVAAIRQFLALPSCQAEVRGASCPQATAEQLRISFLIEDAFGGLPGWGGAAPQLPKEGSCSGTRRSITWATANEWNFEAQSLFRSGMDVKQVISTMMAIYEPMQPTRLISKTRAVEDLAVWAHLLPFEIHGQLVFARDKENLERFLGCQHRDGLAYPVHGGGACPDFNFASIAAKLLLDENLSQGTKVSLANALQRLAEAILRYASPAPIPVAESFRRHPLWILQRLRLDGAVRQWVSPDVFRRHRLDRPCWFSMLMRLMTLEIAGRAQLIGTRHFLRHAELERRIGFNHLSVMFRLLTDS